MSGQRFTTCWVDDSRMKFISYKKLIFCSLSASCLHLFKINNQSGSQRDQREHETEMKTADTIPQSILVMYKSTGSHKHARHDSTLASEIKTSLALS